ncbi:MAG: cytochrome c [Pseudomonadales bacterium]|jgi:nitric oxide reductase subunit C
MSNDSWWASEDFWRKCAIFVTAGMAIVLIVLTFDSVSAIRAGTSRVPAYTVINHRIRYEFDRGRNMMVPVIGMEAPLFGERLDPESARALVDLGKMTIQAKNCMNCHTLLGNGAYYAPDLTKAWLDPGWGNEDAREMLMMMFLRDPTSNARTYGTGRRMPNLGITEAEARGVIAYLKWMSAIDTNGFPANFRSLPQNAGQRAAGE